MALHKCINRSQLDFCSLAASTRGAKSSESLEVKKMKKFVYSASETMELLDDDAEVTFLVPSVFTIV